MIKALVLFASAKEANSLIYQSKIKFIKESSIKYISRNINILITGIGKKSINILNENNLAGSDLIIKAGTAAVIDPEIKLLKAYIPDRIVYNNFQIKIDIKKEYPGYINKILMTLDKPLFNSNKSQELRNNGVSFVDMETFFIMEKLKNNQVIPLVIGTDYGDENAKIDFRNNLSKASEILKNEILNFLKLQ